MSFKHSWKWLPSRVNTAGVPAIPASRPCLAMLEQLEDRVLLSSSTDGGSAGALIGLLRSQLGLHTDEVSLLKAAAGLTGGDKTLNEAFLKIEDDFLKLDGITAFVSLESLVGQKVRVAELKFNNEVLADLNVQGKLFGEGTEGALLPAVQKVISDATASFAAASGLKTAIKGDLKVDIAFLKTEGELLKLDVQLLKLSVEDFKGKLTEDKSSEALLKINETFLKINGDIAAMGDGSVDKETLADVNTMKIATLDFVNSLTTPVITTPTFTGGATLSALGDVIG